MVGNGNVRGWQPDLAENHPLHLTDSAVIRSSQNWVRTLLCPVMGLTRLTALSDLQITEDKSKRPKSDTDLYYSQKKCCLEEGLKI